MRSKKWIALILSACMMISGTNVSILRLLMQMTICWTSTLSGFESVREKYVKRCLTVGKKIRIIENGSEREAFAEGIAPNGFLICSDENGRFEVNSGEVSVRGLMDYI